MSDSMDILQKLVSMVSQMASYGPVGWIIAGVLALIMGGIYFMIWWNKNKLAHQETNKGRTEDQATTPGSSQDIEVPSDSGVQFVDSKKSTPGKPKRPTPQ